MDLVSIKYTHIFHCKTPKNLPKFEFLVWKNHLATLRRSLSKDLKTVFNLLSKCNYFAGPRFKSCREVPFGCNHRQNPVALVVGDGSTHNFVLTDTVLMITRPSTYICTYIIWETQTKLAHWNYFYFSYVGTLYVGTYIWYIICR
jgi:hypothetical protein